MRARIESVLDNAVSKLLKKDLDKKIDDSVNKEIAKIKKDIELIKIVLKKLTSDSNTELRGEQNGTSKK
jgi:hypothetical protein